MPIGLTARQISTYGTSGAQYSAAGGRRGEGHQRPTPRHSARAERRLEQLRAEGGVRGPAKSARAHTHTREESYTVGSVAPTKADSPAPVVAAHSCRAATAEQAGCRALAHGRQNPGLAGVQRAGTGVHKQIETNSKCRISTTVPLKQVPGELKPRIFEQKPASTFLGSRKDAGRRGGTTARLSRMSGLQALNSQPNES